MQSGLLPPEVALTVLRQLIAPGSGGVAGRAYWREAPSADDTDGPTTEMHTFSDGGKVLSLAHLTPAAISALGCALRLRAETDPPARAKPM